MTQQGMLATAAATARKPVIVANDLGIQFKRNRRHRRNFKDLFAESSRRARPDEFWALRNVSFSVQSGEAVGVGR